MKLNAQPIGCRLESALTTSTVRRRRARFPSLVGWAAVAVVLVGLSGAGCGDAGPSDDGSAVEGTGATTGAPPGEAGLDAVSTFLKSEVERDGSPSRAGLNELGTGLADFGFALLRALREEEPEGNILFSPLSLMVPLSMVWEGSVTPTREELHSALRMRLDGEDLHEAMNALEQVLTTDGEDAALALTNAIWLHDQMEVNDAWLDAMARHYGAGVRLANFADDAQHGPIVEAVNAWVEENTRGLIDRILAPDALRTSTVMLLLNTLYLRDDWLIPFDPERTVEGEQVFRSPGGDLLAVDMMWIKAHFRHVEEDGLQAVTLPLEHLPVDALVLLPPEGEGAFLDDLDADRLHALRAAMSDREGTVEIPRLDLAEDPDVYSAMADPMEMRQLLNGGNYHGLGTPPSLEEFRIGNIRHRAALVLNEAGVEAAAATAVEVDENVSDSPPPEPFVFRADRPFLLLLLHRTTGAPLFIAWVEEP